MLNTVILGSVGISYSLPGMRCYSRKRFAALPLACAEWSADDPEFGSSGVNKEGGNLAR